MCKAVLRFFMQNISTKQTFTINVSGDDNTIINSVEGPSNQTFTIKKGENFSIPVSFKTGYQMASVTGAEIVNGNIVVNNVSANTNITVTSEAIPRSITYNLTNTTKPTDAPTTVRNGESFNVVISANDNYNIDPESISVTGCLSYRHEDLVVGNTITQTTIYVEGVNNDVTINVSAIAVDDSYNVNIIATSGNIEILTSTTEDANLTNTTLFTGNINEDKTIYIYLPWKYTWGNTEVTQLDNVVITDPVEVTIDDEKYTKVNLVITAVDGYQTPDVEVIISATEKPTYTITYNEVDGVVSYENKVTTVLAGETITIKPIIASTSSIRSFSIDNPSDASQLIFVNDEDSLTSILENGYTLTVTSNLEVSVEYYVTVSWDGLVGYTIRTQNGTASDKGQTQIPSGIVEYFVAETLDGYEFTSSDIITSDPNAVVNVSSESNSEISFSIQTNIGTTIAINGVSEIVETTYDPLSINVTNNTFDQPVIFNLASTNQSYITLKFSNSETGQNYNEWAVAGFNSSEEDKIIQLGGKGETSYKTQTKALYCPQTSTLDEFDSMQITLYGDVRDVNNTTYLSKSQIVYATIQHENGTTSTSTTAIVNGDSVNDGITLTFDSTVSFDAKNPLTLYYTLTE